MANIVIDLLMRTGSFETDTKRASKALRDFQRDAVESVTRATTALLGLGGAAAGAFLALERGAASIGRFKDIGQVIGDTGQAVASLQTASDVSGVAMNEVADISVKLTKALSKVDEESEGAAKALTALGIPLADFKALSPVQQIEALSKALDGFKDDKGATETMEALVRGGSRLIPLLKELREQGGPRVIITQEQIDAADRFADATGKLKSQVTQLGQSVLADLLPPFQAFVDEMGEADRALSIFSVAGGAVRIFFETITVLGANVIFVFKGIGNEIGGIAAQLVALAKFDFSGFNAISKAMKEDAARARAELDKFEQRILGATAAADETRRQRRVEDRGFDPRPKIDTSGFASGAGKDDAAKKLLDNQIKAQEAIIRREQDLLTERNRFLNLFNEQGLISIRAYYDAQVAIVEAATTAQIAAIDKQIALTQAARAKATKDTDRADLTGKIDELTTKRAKTEQEATSKSLELSIRREQAEKRFATQIESTRANVLELQGSLAAAAAIRFDVQNQELIARAAAEGNTQLQALLETLRAAQIEQAKFAEGSDLRQINANVLELRGNLGAAAAIRFDEQNFALVQRLTAQGNKEGLALVQTLRQATIAQAEFGKAAADTQRVTDSLANAEDRIAISRQLGATTELGALQQLGAERQKALVQMEAMVAAQEAIAKASGNPVLVQNAERARIELERLRAVADPLGDKFRTVFSDSASDALTDFITGTKSASEAFKAFADSVIQQISRIVAQNLAESIFGKGGAGSALPGFFASLFGGGFAEGGSPPVGKVSIGGERGAELFVRQSAARSLLAGAEPLGKATLIGKNGPQFFRPTVPGVVIPAEETAAILARFPGFGGAFAGGGWPAVGRGALGGEEGAELFLPRTHALRPPENESRSARGAGEPGDTFIEVSVAGQVDRRTRYQIANDIALEQRRAARVA